MRRSWHLSLVVALLLGMAGCENVESQDPHSSFYSEITLAVGEGSSASATSERMVEVDWVTFWYGGVPVADPAPDSHLYLRAGDYHLSARCLRDWPDSDPRKGHQMPYGMAKHGYSGFDVSIPGGKKYVLDCAPGLDRSSFFLREVTAEPTVKAPG